MSDCISLALPHCEDTVKHTCNHLKKLQSRTFCQSLIMDCNIGIPPLFVFSVQVHVNENETYLLELNQLFAIPSVFCTDPPKRTHKC